MTWQRKTATAVSALLFAMGGVLVTAPPAAADGPCPKNRLCIYDEPGFRGDRIISASTNACFFMDDFVFYFQSIVSYDNNLPVDAIVWQYHGEGKPWTKDRTLVAGQFSSDIGIPHLGADAEHVCMGNARP